MYYNILEIKEGDAEMDTQIVQIMANYCFPAVMCYMMFDRMNKESDMHRSEISDLKDVLEKNTLALTELKETLKEKK